MFWMAASMFLLTAVSASSTTLRRRRMSHCWRRSWSQRRRSFWRIWGSPNNEDEHEQEGDAVQLRASNTSANDGSALVFVDCAAGPPKLVEIVEMMVNEEAVFESESVLGTVESDDTSELEHETEDVGTKKEEARGKGKGTSKDELDSMPSAEMAADLMDDDEGGDLNQDQMEHSSWRQGWTWLWR